MSDNFWDVNLAKQNEQTEELEIPKEKATVTPVVEIDVSLSDFPVGNWDSEKVSFYLPYLDGDKETILRDAEQSIEKLNLDFDTIFANTNTSYNPDEQGRSSGKSGADIERILAFNAIGRKDPVPYVEDWSKTLEHAIKVEKEHKEKI